MINYITCVRPQVTVHAVGNMALAKAFVTSVQDGLSGKKTSSCFIDAVTSQIDVLCW